MSGGQIDIELFPGGSLVPSKDIIPSVGKNIVEMGASAASYVSGLIPVVYTTLVPMGPRSAEECAMIWLQGWDKILRAAYDKLGVKLLTMMIVTDIPLYSIKPIRKVEDIKGMKIRTHGSTALFVEQLGASTVFIPGEEVYMALSTKAIDAATWGGFASTFPRKWFEVAKYVIHPPLVPMYQQNDLAINKRVFNSLPEELQGILQTAADLAMWDCRMGEAMNNEAAWQKMKAAGNEIITLPAADVAKMTEAARHVWDNVASRSPDSYQAMKIITDLLRQKGHTDYVIEKRSITVKK
jgi:TRAP-type C4-dicarboxylate transport system substrate-binding protein